jgi:hypothetical protein
VSTTIAVLNYNDVLFVVGICLNKVLFAPVVTIFNQYICVNKQVTLKVFVMVIEYRLKIFKEQA